MKVTITIPDQDVPKLQRMNELLSGHGLKVPCEYMELRGEVSENLIPAVLNAMEIQE